MFIDFDRESIQKRKVPLGKITVVQKKRKSRVIPPLMIHSLDCAVALLSKNAVRASWQSASEFLYNRACNTHYSKLTKDSKNKRKNIFKCHIHLREIFKI